MQLGGKTLLKARPTPCQLADRVRQPVPDGIELYMATEDLLVRREEMAERILAHRPDAGFSYVVEGPLRSFDGAFFDVTVDNEANREVLQRLAALGKAIGAQAAVIHAIAPRSSFQELVGADRESVLRQSLSLLGYYADQCETAGIVASIEDVPPVAFMREARPSYSLLGVAPEDMVFLCRSVPGLRVTLDVSHAQLYINAANGDPGAAPPGLTSLAQYWRERRSVRSLDEYIDTIQGYLVEAHLSNARGITGEGLACYDGDLDLATVARRLAPLVQFLVTETIEPDPDRSTLMREVQQCLQAALV